MRMSKNRWPAPDGKKILLTDKSKFGQTFLAGHAHLAEFEIVITQTGLPDDILSQLNAQNIQVLLADSAA